MFDILFDCSPFFTHTCFAFLAAGVFCAITLRENVDVRFFKIFYFLIRVQVPLLYSSINMMHLCAPTMAKPPCQQP